MRERGGRRLLQRLALVFVIPLALLSGCSFFDEPSVAVPTPAANANTSNLLKNSGFTDGQLPWTSLTSDDGTVAVTSDADHDANGAADLQLGSGTPTSIGIAGVSQRIDTTTFPEFMSGYYRVDAWNPAAVQYLQVVVTVRGGDFADGLPAHELRLPLAGLQYEPVPSPLARYQFVTRAAPVMGKWTYFSYPIRQAFLTKWDALPTRWDEIDLSFEVRYDAGPPEHPAGTAQVLYDDLYAGPQAANPNRPTDP